MSLATFWIALSVVCGFLGAFLLRRSGRPGVGVLLGVLLGPVWCARRRFLGATADSDPHEDRSNFGWDGHETREDVGDSARANAILDRTSS